LSAASEGRVISRASKICFVESEGGGIFLNELSKMLNVIV
jgi:hypothetical protein